MSSGSTTQSSGTSTSVNQIPEWMSNAGQQNYAFAQNVAEQPLQQYQGQMVAGIAPQTQQAWNVAANSGNVGSDQFNGATAGYLGALAATPSTVTPQSLGDLQGKTKYGSALGSAFNRPDMALGSQMLGNNASGGLANYLNPYTNQVINSTIPIMAQQNALSQNQQANQANSANAFGGSKQGVQQGVAQAQGAQNIGQMIANLQNQNFTQAQAAATGDISRNLQAQTTNQQANQAKINSDIMASQGLTNTGDSMNKANLANYGMLTSAGAGQSMQAQNQINAQMAKFNQAFNYPQQQLGTLLSALGMTPHDTSTSSQTTSQTTTPTDWASLIEGGLKGASSLYSMSDRSEKTDIKKLGKDPKTGLEMHAFRYKGDPKSYPKVVGPMAQDVEKKFPGSTEEVGEKGKLAIKGYAAGTPNVSRSDPAWAPEFDIRGGDMGIPVSRQAELERALAEAHGVRGYAAGTAFVGQPSLAAFTPPSSPGVAKGIGALSAFRPPLRLPRGAGMPKMQKFDRGTASVPGFGSTDTVPAMLTPGEAVLTPGAAKHIGRGNISALNAMMPPVRGQATSMPRAGARGIQGALANTKLRPKIAGALSG